MNNGAAPLSTPQSRPNGRGLLAGHPAGLSALFFTELWERFSYYGMRALLTLFMVAPVAAGGLGLDTPEAARIYGNYTFAVYMLAIPGGFLADALLGARRSVLAGGSVIAAGHYTLAIPADQFFIPGLILIAIGTGLFKPSISAMVGALYGRDDARRDSGFSIFYMGINIGGFIAPLVTGYLAQSAVFKDFLASRGFDPAMSWHWGFGAAGAGMTIALLIFATRRDVLSGIGLPPVITPDLLGRALAMMFGALALMGLILLSDQDGFADLRWLFLALPAGLAFWFAQSDDDERRRLAAVAVFFIAAMIFWAIFEQAGLSIALFADQMTRLELGGMAFPSSWFQSLNPLFVILLSPVFAWGWLKLGPSQPASPVKFVLGLAALALSFLLMVPAAALTIEGKVSPLWLVGLFFLQTVGELCLSPVGLSLMTKLAPIRFVGLVLGAWFLAAALGNKLAGVLGGQFSASDPQALGQFFLTQAIMVSVAAAILAALVPWTKRLMGDVK